jgi:C4-dicarboxylate transporter, DctQ subunit
VTSSVAFALAGFGAVVVLAAARARLDRSDRARGFFDAAGRAELLFVTLLLCTLVVLGAVQIFLRNAFHSGLLWADPMMRHIVLWLGATGAALASARMRHISVDVFTRLLPAAWRPARRVLVYGATAIAAYLLAIAALRLVVDERTFSEVAFLGVKTWVAQLILPAAFFVIAYRTLLAIFLRRESRDVEFEG